MLLTAFAGYRYWTGTPQYSLLRARDAVISHDLGTFEKYVAIDMCADGLVNDVMDSAMANVPTPPTDPNKPFEEMGRKFAERFMLMIKPALARVLKEKTREYVSTGTLASGAEGKGTPGNFEETKQKIEDKSLRYAGIGNVEVSGEEAIVSLNFENKETNQTYPLNLKMRRVEDYWQVTRWQNAAEFLKEVGADPETKPAPAGNP